MLPLLLVPHIVACSYIYYYIDVKCELCVRVFPGWVGGCRVIHVMIVISEQNCTASSKIGKMT